MDDKPLIIFTKDWTDEERFEYLVELDESETEVTAWEAGFINSVLAYKNMTKFSKQPLTLSEKQRKVVENLYEKYRD